MKTKNHFTTRTSPVALLLALLSTLNPQPSTLFAQGTAFTYQGRLNDGTNAANGSYDLRFYLRDAVTAGNPVGSTNTISPVAVSNGFFSVTLDFGSGIFTGADRWLEIGVRTNGAISFNALTPRQPVLPSPYAIHAAEAMNLLNGTVSNPTFIGTTTNAPLDLFANNQRGLRLESPAGGVPNLVIGGTGSSIDPSAVGSTIAGGGVPGFPNSIGVSSSFIGAGNANSITGPAGYNNNFIGAGYQNSIASVASFIGAGNNNFIQTDAWYSFIGAGSNNTVLAGARLAVIGGGEGNMALRSHATIGGGYFNTASGDLNIGTGDSGTVAGGWQNSALGNNAAVAGGRYNSSLGDDSAVAGGAFNASLGLQSAIGGGIGNTNSSTRAFIGAGYYNTIEPGANASVVGGGTQNTIAVGAIQSTISGGNINVIAAGAQVAVIAGGSQNQIVSNAIAASIGGGRNNTNAGFAAVIAGGSQNWIDSSADYAAIGGGRFNTNASFAAVIAGGSQNTISSNADFASISGGTLNTNSGHAAVIAGGSQNRIDSNADYAAIGGGRFNTNEAFAATIGGGRGHLIETNSQDSVIAGGFFNNIVGGSQAAVIGGGAQNLVTRSAAVIAGGSQNTNDANAGVIGGGLGNSILSNSLYSTIGGGSGNTIQTNASYATVPGGRDNIAGGQYSFAAGWKARATNANCFVWSDGSTNTFSTSSNQFVARATNGFYFYTSATMGAWLPPGAPAWMVMSDRNAKKDFAPIDTRAVLEKLAALPIQRWHYKWEAADSPLNLGPMAQDFKQAFYPGRDDKGISTLEFDGVELAAIQGLDQKLEEQAKAILAKDARIADLEQRLSRLEKMISFSPEKR